MCTNRLSVFAIVIAVWLSGCSSRVYGPSRVQDTVAILPDGGKILLSQDVWNNPGLMGMFAAKPERTLEGPLCIWQRPDRPDCSRLTSKLAGWKVDVVRQTDADRVAKEHDIQNQLSQRLLRTMRVIFLVVLQ